MKHIWSDEYSVERGAGKAREWVFCTPSQKWQKEMVQTLKKKGQGYICHGLDSYLVAGWRVRFQTL